MAATVADRILQRLREWGVEQVFGYPGDGINGIVAAFGEAGDDPAFVQSRHEETAAFEAVGYAKFSGRTGVCAATSGPGAIHLLNGLYDAKLDHVPVVAVVGQTARSAMGGAPKFEQSQSLPRIFYADFAAAIGLEGVAVDDPEDLAAAWDRAFAADKPVVLDVRCDPAVPPIPPHATLARLRSTTETLLKGDPEAWDVFVRGAETKAREMLPGRR